MHHGHQSFTADAVAGIAFLCVLVGWTVRKLWQANDDVRSLRTRLNNSKRVAWRARRIGAVVGLVLLAALWHWIVTLNGG